MAETANHASHEPWPSLDTASWLFDRASFVLIGALVLGAVATILIVWMGIVKEEHWDLLRDASKSKVAALEFETARANEQTAKAHERIAELSTQAEGLKRDAAEAQADIAKANASGDAAKAESARATERVAELSTQAEGLKKDTAEANARAAQAQLSLQRLSVPRMLDPKSFIAELKDVTPPSRVEILFVEECSDCWMLASMVLAVLNDMKWPTLLSPLRRLTNPPDWLAPLPATIQHRGNPVGVSIVTTTVGDFADKTSGAAFVRAISKSIEGRTGWSRDESLPENVIKLVVAPKV